MHGKRVAAPPEMACDGGRASGHARPDPDACQGVMVLSVRRMSKLELKWASCRCYALPLALEAADATMIARIRNDDSLVEMSLPRPMTRVDDVLWQSSRTV